MKLYTGKNRLLLLGVSRATAAIDNSYIESVDVMIDSNLTFENHINSNFKKAIQKLNVLARIVLYLTIQKQRTIKKSFVTS